ncbi:MAG: ABC transporter ATP-binding protein [Clostridia bacterium]|nr:ABC transporter ATP-binding protein [Clostridia bacterium]
MDHKVEIRNLDYGVPAREILREVSLRVDQKQFVGLIGPNGSGKTTLLKHIYRALPPEKNRVFINGQAIEHFSFREAARQVTVMRQENGSDFDYTILEMVLMGRSPYRKFYERDTDEDRNIARDALRYMGMEAMANQPFSTLSGGEKQRVLIARSLAQEADILVLDEPTNHLDVHYQWLLMEVIAGLKKTVLSVFHELNLACAFCDSLYVLKEGRIVAQGSPRDICTPQLLQDVFGVRAEVIELEDGRPYIIYLGSIQ